MSINIDVSVTLDLPVKEAWELYTNPLHITKWYFADSSWHAPHATNDLTIGKDFHIYMEAKDKSFGFDFSGTYKDIRIYQSLDIVLGDLRTLKVTFQENQGKTTITQLFEAEKENPIELQKQGWQAILNQLKTYSET